MRKAGDPLRAVLATIQQVAARYQIPAQLTGRPRNGDNLVAEGSARRDLISTTGEGWTSGRQPEAPTGNRKVWCTKSMTVLADGPEATPVDPVASACLRLGWCIEELFSRFEVPEGPPPDYDLAQLPGLSKLTSYDWQRLGLDQADFVVGQVTAKVGAPPAIALNLTTNARSKLQATIEKGEGAASRRQEYRAALAKLHVDLLVVLTAADPAYGNAYGLGRALADTTCPQQTPAELAMAFERHRIGQLYVWLDELASLLPDHAARAVAQSLDWWQQAVTAAAAGSKLSTTSTPASDKDRPASHPGGRDQATASLRRQRPRAANGQTELPSMEALAAAVARQGALWRGVLDGDKLCIDLLTPQDYLRAGDRLARHYAGLAWPRITHYAVAPCSPAASSGRNHRPACIHPRLRGRADSHGGRGDCRHHFRGLARNPNPRCPYRRATRTTLVGR